MLRKRCEMKDIFKEHLYGGSGFVNIFSTIQNQAELNDHATALCVLTIPPGSEIAHHQHKGDMEVYFLLSGSGVFYDNDDRVVMEKYDAGFTYDGEYHGFMNIGDVPAEMLCLIIPNKK